MRMLKPTTSLIGLDIGRSSIKAVQISSHDKGPRLDGCVMLDRPAPVEHMTLDEAQRLLRAMERRGMTATRVVLVAPTEALVGGSMNVPPADKGVSREKIVEMELSRTHRLSPGSFEMAWWDLPAPSSGSRIGQAHALGLPHAAVAGTLEVLSELDLSVVRTLPGSLALLAAGQRHPIDPRCIAAVLDLGSTRGHLSLMYAGRVVHERALHDFNMQSLCEEAQERIGVDSRIARYALSRYGLDVNPQGLAGCETATLLSEAMTPLAEEIGMSFAYVSHLYPEAELGHLLLTGGGANLPGIASSLGELLELDTAVTTPSTLLPGEHFGQEHQDPALVAAMGAALCGEVVS